MAPSPGVARDLPLLFLSRLRCLLAKRHAPDSSLSEQERKTLDRAIYSTLCDCLALGLTSQARTLLRELQPS